MTFTKKSLQPRSRLGFLKGITIFFLGASCVLFVTNAFMITPSAPNAVQFIMSIFLTMDGSNNSTGTIALNGASGDAYFLGKVGIGITGPVYMLDVAGTGSVTALCLSGDCRNVWPTGGGGSTGAIPGGITGSVQFNDGTNFSGGNDLFWDSTNKRLGIGTNTPTDNTLQIVGNITSSGFIGRGNGVIANGVRSTAMGYGTTASGRTSTAMGYNTIANGAIATAMGYNTIANGQSSTAMGENTIANGSASTAMGFHTQANGYASTAMGVFTTANGQFSTAMGYYTIASGLLSTAIGAYNIGLSNSIFEIGIGTSPSARVNAMTVLFNGNVGIGTTGPATKLDVDGGIKAKTLTADPCFANAANYPEGTLFYNGTNFLYCYCGNTLAAKRVHDNTVCF